MSRAFEGLHQPTPLSQSLGVPARVDAYFVFPRPSEAALQILFEDNHCLALCKPAPLLTQGPPGVPSLEAQAKAYLKERLGKPGNVYLGVPHRLDRPVSGVVLFARNSKAAARLADQFQQRQVRKTYWGLVEGCPAHDAGAWTDWLRKLPDLSRAECVPEGAQDAKRAELAFRVVRRLAGLSWLEFQPTTGRMHQIRVQAAARGLPLLGDILYGARQPFGPEPAHPRDRLIALHGQSLSLRHPLSYEPWTLRAPLPELWKAYGVDEEAAAHVVGE